MFKVQTLNPISPLGLDHFPKGLYEVGSTMENPDGIVVRSHNMLEMPIPNTLKIVGRAGTGVNNIPIAEMTKRGIPVLNTPGANANAVRELVLAGMLLASRHICEAWHYVNRLEVAPDEFEKRIEQDKKQFQGFELLGKTLGVIGLGSVGVKVANAAKHLGMNVIGYDPAITVSRAWELSSDVMQAKQIEDLLKASDFISFHVPLLEETRHMLNDAFIQLLKPNAVVLNFSRDGIVDSKSLLEALNAQKILAYVTDFPMPHLQNHPRVICFPHLGASTQEAEDNCAVMIVKQIRDYLETGCISHAVNFPSLDMSKNLKHQRLCIVNLNVPNMVAQISSKLASQKINIASLANQSRGDIAYTVIDSEQTINPKLSQEIASIEGIIQVRMIP